MGESEVEGDPDQLVRCFQDRPPGPLFSVPVRQPTDGPEQVGIEFEPRLGGILREQKIAFGTVTSDLAGAALTLASRPVHWTDAPEATLRIGATPVGGGREVALDLRGWPALLDAAGGALSDWFAPALLPAIVRQLTPGGWGDRVMDQLARRPAGAAVIEAYRDPRYHRPIFLLVLGRLRSEPDDRLLDVGCGGGSLLKRALAIGCSATRVDHRPERVRPATEENRGSVDADRLSVLQGDVGDLPVADLSCSACVIVLSFGRFPDPRGAVRGMHRALRPDGLRALFVDALEARGTPAAPEPFASRGRSYTPAERSALATEARFGSVQLEEPNLLPCARAARLPPEVVRVFDGTGGSPVAGPKDERGLTRDRSGSLQRLDRSPPVAPRRPPVLNSRRGYESACPATRYWTGSWNRSSPRSATLP